MVQRCIEVVKTRSNWSATYLAPVVPFRVYVVVNDIGFELLRANGDNRIWIRFTLAQHANVHLH